MPDRHRPSTPSAEALFRKAVIAAWERIPVADRPWNQRVADALWADQRFRQEMREYVIRAEDEGLPNHA